jgi:ketosteroid isomerase-like protein
MGLLFRPGRPVAHWAASGAPADQASRSNRPKGESGLRGYGVPGFPVRDTGPAPERASAPQYQPMVLDEPVTCPPSLSQGLDALATGDVSVARDVFARDVVGWWPTFSIHSREELEAAMAEREGALSDVHLTVRCFGVDAGRAAAEWVMTAVHTGPLLVADDILIEPSHERVILAGATFAEIEEGRISSFRHYFDDAAIIEQLLLAGA